MTHDRVLEPVEDARGELRKVVVARALCCPLRIDVYAADVLFDALLESGARVVLLADEPMELQPIFPHWQAARVVPRGAWSLGGRPRMLAGSEPVPRRRPLVPPTCHLRARNAPSRALRRPAAGRSVSPGASKLRTGVGPLPDVVEDLVEGSLVIAGQEDIVVTDLRVLLVHAPVKHDRGAGIELFVQFFGRDRIGQQFLVDIRQVCVSDEDIGFERFPVLQEVGIKRWVNGAFTFTPDGNPLVGPVDGVPNYWAACGCMAGFSQGAGIGLALANWIVDGDPGYDVFGMDVARFGPYASNDRYAGRDDGKEKGEMMALYYKRDRFEKLDSGHFWLSETPDVPGSKSWGAWSTRMCTWVKLQPLEDYESWLAGASGAPPSPALTYVANTDA